MRAFYIQCSGPHWIGIAHALSVRAIEPVLWSGDDATLAGVREGFPGIPLVNGTAAARGELPEARDWAGTAFDAAQLSALAPDEVIGLAMMDRMDAGGFGHEARRRHWHLLLGQWGGVLDALAPEVVIFAMAPHAIYDYALYALCKQRDIATLMFERAQLPGLVFVVERFEKGSDAMRDALRRTEQTTRALGPEASAHLSQLRGGGAGALPPNYRKKLEGRGLMGRAGRQKEAGMLRTLGFELMRTAYLALRRRAAPANYNVYEDREGRLVSPNLCGWLFGRWRGQFKKARLRRLTRELAGTPPLGAPYVLLALHFQPERAIVPMAGAFCDQTLIVDMLARSLPGGWVLVVKEHPWQLVPFGRGELGRSAGFYRRITAHPNVVLTTGDAKIEDLMLGARAVATATGSIGWQAIARRIPALVFGAAWYGDAPGVFRITDHASLSEAIRRIEAGDAVPADAAERMLAALEDVAVPGVLEPDIEDTGAVAASNAATAMADALAAHGKMLGSARTRVA
jgi:hypothetical protein